MKTKVGELSIKVLVVRPARQGHPPRLPDKWHGLSDGRHPATASATVDLIANEDARRVFAIRFAAVGPPIRRLLARPAGYVEVETPILQPIAGGATAARPVRDAPQTRLDTPSSILRASHPSSTSSA